VHATSVAQANAQVANIARYRPMVFSPATFRRTADHCQALATLARQIRLPSVARAIRAATRLPPAAWQWAILEKPALRTSFVTL